MIAAWMLYAAAAALLLALAAAGVDRLLRLVGRATRWVWAAAMLLSLALPPLAWWQGAAAARADAASGRPGPVAAKVAMDDAALDALLARATLAVEPAGLLPRLDAPLLAVWGALSLAALGWLGAAQRRLQRARREWRPAVVEETPVLVAGRTGPAVAGVLRPAVVLPEWALAGDRALLRLMLAHEREHLRAADPRLLAAAAVAVALAPWNLALWYQLRRLRLAVEIDCDRRVLRRHPDVRRYAALLLEVGRHAPRTPALPLAALAAGPTSLERRIRTMTMRRPRHPLLQGFALAATSALAAAGALVVPQPAVATLQAQERAAVRQRTPGNGMERLRRIVAEAMPELLTEVSDSALTITIVADADGNVVSAAYERMPAGLPKVGGETPGADEAQAVKVRQPRAMAELGLDPSDIGSVRVLKVAAGQVAADAASVIWVQLKSDTQRTTEEALTAARAAAVAEEAPVAGASVRLRSERATPATTAEVAERQAREAEVRARMEMRLDETVVAAQEPGSAVRLRLPEDPENAPIYVVDGVIVSPESMHLVRELDPRSIDSIEVLKGAAAEKLYGARAAKGVITITTKPAPPPQL